MIRGAPRQNIPLVRREPVAMGCFLGGQDEENSKYPQIQIGCPSPEDTDSS